MEKNLKEMQDMQFSWLKTGKHFNRGNFDVSIGLSTGNKERFNLIFRNGTFKHFKTGRIDIAVFKNRVVFRESNYGWKLSGDSKAVAKENRYCQFVVSDDNKILKEFTGDYELKYDRLYEVYYVEKTEE